MSLPPDSPWRGCASAYPQPLSEEDVLAAQFLTETVYYMNTHEVDPPIEDIEYRSSAADSRHVFRWDRAHYQEVFRTGFGTRPPRETPDNIFYNLNHYVNNGGRPLGNSVRPNNYAFVSTTLSSRWHPSISHDQYSGSNETVVEAWRYEIYAPGGIWVTATLDGRYNFPSQDEICYVAAIAPQFIRSAQLFRLSIGPNQRHARRQRVDTVLYLNANFNPQSHPSRLINILRPIRDYRTADRTYARLTLSIYNPATNTTDIRTDVQPGQRRLLSTLDPSSIPEWYVEGAADELKTYIDAAFRSSYKNEVYLFMKDEYVLINYAPGSKNDRVLNGPLLIRDGFPSLKGTTFAEYGIDCAFGSHDKNEAFVFSMNFCAHINFAPHTTNDTIIKGPKKISKMFPFLKKTVFESGIDAAFEATAKYEAYLFKDDMYALINYGPSSPHLIAIRAISQGFYGLRKSIFESGIQAAFASHHKNEAYIFKGDHYALINFAPGTTNDFIVGGKVKQILPNWPCLQPVLPRSNCGTCIDDTTRL